MNATRQGVRLPASLRTAPLSRIFWGFKSKCEMFRSLRNWRAQAVGADTREHQQKKRRTVFSEISEIECKKKTNFYAFVNKEAGLTWVQNSCLKSSLSHLSVAGSSVPLSQVKSFGCEWSARDLRQNTTPGSNKCSQHPTNQKEQLKHRGNDHRKTHIILFKNLLQEVLQV